MHLETLLKSEKCFGPFTNQHHQYVLRGMFHWNLGDDVYIKKPLSKFDLQKSMKLSNDTYKLTYGFQ